MAHEQQQTGSQGKSIEVKGKPSSGGMTRREQWGNWLSQQRGSPFGMMRRMFDDLDQMFGGGVMGMSPWMEQSMSGAGWMPAIELVERGNDMVLMAELPGCKRDDINIRVKDGILTLEGERRSEHEDKREGMIHSERSYGRFMRSMSLPQDVDANAIRASFKDGILEIAMPRTGDTGARQIEIGDGGGAGSTKH